MQSIKDSAAEFLTHKRVAVTGVSRSPKDHGANVVYRRFRDVNQFLSEVEGLIGRE